uniref:Uncharacterized protein n=1 Tax=Ascaris lumbricoides TaxID=6252 RepID=A0A9J2PBM2_ASCLU
MSVMYSDRVLEILCYSLSKKQPARILLMRVGLRDAFEESLLVLESISSSAQSSIRGYKTHSLYPTFKMEKNVRVGLILSNVSELFAMTERCQEVNQTQFRHSVLFLHQSVCVIVYCILTRPY